MHSKTALSYWRTVMFLLVLFCAGMAFTVWQASRSHSRLVTSAVLHQAAHYSDLLSVFRSVYTSEVVETAAGHGLEVTHDYKSKDGAVPLPATLTMLIGKRIDKTAAGARVRLYSDHPFPWRSDHDSLDAFGTEALQHLRRTPEDPFYRIEEDDGRTLLRYASADVMQQSCVSCHNSHADSPKKDWKVGDVRGVLEIALPMDAAVARADSELQSTLFLAGGAGLLGLIGMLVVVRRLRGLSADLEERVNNRVADLEESRNRERQREQQVTRAVEAAPNGMVMINDQGEITLINTKVEEMFGYERSELLGKPIEMLVPSRFRADHPDHRRRYFQSPEVRSMGEGRDLFGVRKDGSEFSVELGLNPIETDQGLAVLASVIDITQRKKAESELRQYAEMVAANNASLQQYAEEADAANRAKSEFLASMSHELRTPLNAVIGFSEGLLDRVDRHPLNKHQIDRLSKIKKSGDHLLALINNVLDLAKVESGRLEIHATEFEVGPLAEEIAALAEGLLKDRSDVKFRLELPQPGTKLRSDRDKVKQVLINLVGNAVKFTGQGQITLRIEQDLDHIRMSVEDTGIGIPEDQLPRIFEKFHQVDQAEHRSIKGTGLGLALCHSFSSLLGGVLTVRSVEGQGSVFTFTVPLEYNARSQQERQELVEQIKDRCRRTLPAGQDLKVLCIEDDPTNMEVLLDFLEGEGLQAIPAFDGHEGLKLARDELPDAITLDVMMPGLDGWEVLRRLKADPTTSDIPVIMTTAIDDKSLALNLGADGFMLKPIQGHELCDAVDRLSAKQGRQLSTLAIVGDSPEVRGLLQEVLEVEGYQIQLYSSEKQFLASVESDPPDAAILDLTPEGDGFGVLDALRSNSATAELPVIVMTAKMLSGDELGRLQGRIRAVIEKNGLSRDKALAQLIAELESLKRGAATT